MMYSSYNLDVEALRQELVTYLKTNPKWDGQVVALQVVDMTENNMQLRILCSAKNAPTVWDLRCEVREHLIAYLQATSPQALPGTKISFPAMSPGDGSSGFTMSGDSWFSAAAGELKQGAWADRWKKKSGARKACRRSSVGRAAVS